MKILNLLLVAPLMFASSMAFSGGGGTGIETRPCQDGTSVFLPEGLCSNEMSMIASCEFPENLEVTYLNYSLRADQATGSRRVLAYLTAKKRELSTLERLLGVEPQILGTNYGLQITETGEQTFSAQLARKARFRKFTASLDVEFLDGAKRAWVVGKINHQEINQVIECTTKIRQGPYQSLRHSHD